MSRRSNRSKSTSRSGANNNNSHRPSLSSSARRNANAVDSLPAEASATAAAAAAAAAVRDAPLRLPSLPAAGNQSVPAHVRQRQRRVAEREASRLARPEQRPKKILAHSSKAARTSTPFGVLSRRQYHQVEGDEEEWCGPFSVARQMIAAREEAKRKRLEELAEENGDDDDGGVQRQGMNHPLDALMEQVELERKKKAHPSMQWKSNLILLSSSSSSTTATTNKTPNNMYAKRQKRVQARMDSQVQRVPSLAQLCVNFVVEHFEYVESLGDVDNDVRLAISKELVSRNKLDDKAFQALVSVVGVADYGGDGDGGADFDNTYAPPPPPPPLPSTLETLEIVDCAGISHDVMAKTLQAVSGSLVNLLLTNAGRCFGTKAVKALLKEIKDGSGTVHYTPRAQLQCLSISGAYLLKDEDAARLITADAATLQSVAFETCPLLGNKLIQALQGLRVQASHSRLLELCFTDMTNFAADNLRLLAEKSGDALQSIKSLTLQNVVGLTDDMVASILAAVGSSLDNRLDLSHNHDLTDATLSAIRQFNPRVKILVLDGLKELTAPGLEALFTPLPEMGPPPKLKVLRVALLHHEAVTDNVMKLAAAGISSSVDEHGPTAGRVTGGNTGLVQLDVSGSSVLNDTFLEDLVETSAQTLEELNVSYCPLVTDQGLGYLVSKAGRQLKTISVWGCAQLSDLFFDGHDRAQDGTLEIVGAWMKKSGTRSMR